jgi:hypothetical protein
MNPKPRQLSPQEWQLLSAYLDNQVSPAERNQIEKQLASDAAYRQAAESLRQTRTVIRGMPLRRVPHAFTLTPDMVKARRKWGLFPALRLSSAFAAIASVVLFALQLLPGMMNVAAPAAAPVAPDAMALSSAEEAIGTEPPVIYWGGPPAEAKGMGGGGGGDGTYPGGMGGGAPDTIYGMPNTAATPAIQFEIPQATQAAGVGAAAPQESMPADPTPEPPMALAQQPTAAPETARSAEELQNGPVLGLRPQDSGKVIAESQSTAANQAVEEEPSIPTRSLLPAAIGLAGLAVITAIATLLLNKKSRV